HPAAGDRSAGPGAGALGTGRGRRDGVRGPARRGCEAGAENPAGGAGGTIAAGLFRGQVARNDCGGERHPHRDSEVTHPPCPGEIAPEPRERVDVMRFHVSEEHLMDYAAGTTSEAV